MRVFCASIATETNTFSPLRTDLSDFRQSFYAPPGKHPETPTLCSAVFPALRDRAKKGEVELVEGTATWAEPGGLVSAQCWDSLRDEVLGQLEQALPVQAVVLGLHGAMVAENCLDCEGQLVKAARRLAGPDAVIGMTFDPHSHLGQDSIDNADVITVFKEFPHTDFVEAAEDCVDLTLRAAAGKVKPALSVYDARMIDIFPTSNEPMKGFVTKLRALEEKGEALSISVIHGFIAGDSPDLGTKVVVVTDNQAAKGDELAKRLGEEVYSFRGKAMMELLPPDEALDHAGKASNHPVVIADVWDNPGGGVAGDSTILLGKALEKGIRDLALGPLWDPMAVRICFAAGEGARLDLRFGGKTSAHAGDPIDAKVEVTKLANDACQSFGASKVPLGDCAAIRIGDAEVVLSSNRSQAFSPDLFTNLGINASEKKVLIVKSTNHFRAAFAQIAPEIIYAAVEGIYPNPRTAKYNNLERHLWPMVEDPHSG